MPKSAAFARIKAAILTIARAIPAGNISSHKAIGDYLDVMPRHVAYILATLSAQEQIETPWYRVVGDGGKITREQRDAQGITQAEHLAAEGVIVNGQQVADFERLCFSINAETTGVQPIVRDSAEGAQSRRQRSGSKRAPKDPA